MSLSGQTRLEQIRSQVTERQQVTVKELSDVLAVSEATVRRDLKQLADNGEVQLVYGGATVPRNTGFSFRAKGLRHMDAKRTIGRLAAELVSDEELIFMDSGTTSFEMIPFLKARRSLSIIANSARLALEVNRPDINVILLGGQYRPDRMDTVGPLAQSSLEQLRGYIAFVGADGLSREFGIAAADIESAHLYRLAVGNARQTVLLVDHTKFEAPSLFKIVDWQAIGRIVTDAPPAPDWMEFLAGRGVEVIYPGSKEKQE